jgi:hypothetical protein
MSMKALIAFAAYAALASAVAARPSYGGGHHTSSHGGRYSGSYSGSSHKGGSYRNVHTSNRYGTHKR